MTSEDGTWSDESDWEIDESEYASDLEEFTAPPPVIAVVGRPNVGKSTLVNRILGRREAVVQDLPGVTRDRVSYDALWAGRRIVVQDTGGWEPDAKGLQQLVAEQATVAMQTADAIILVVDAVVGATSGDEAAARKLRRSGKPVFWPPTRLTVRSRSPRPRRCGRWVSVSRTRSAPCTGAGSPICSTPSSRSCRRSPRWAPRPAGRGGWRWWASPTWARARC